MEIEFTDQEIDEVWITARDNGYKFAEVDLMFTLIFLSEDSRSAYDYILQGLKDKKNAGIMCRKLTRELPDSAVEYWDDSVFGKRSEWGKAEDEQADKEAGH